MFVHGGSSTKLGTVCVVASSKVSSYNFQSYKNDFFACINTVDYLNRRQPVVFHTLLHYHCYILYISYLLM